MKLLLLMLSMNLFAELEPNTIMLDLTMAPQSFLALEGKERCKDWGHKAQERANAVCFAYRHISAVELGFTTMESDLDYLMKAKNYGFIEIDPKIYECKKPRRHPIYLKQTKFVKINCLTL